MTAAPEIPANVMTAAHEAAREYRPELYSRPLIDVIARAIHAERQRCVDYVRRRPGAVANRQEIAAGLERGDVCDAFGSITQGPTI